MFRTSAVRAVIVGISDYQNISDLDYADRDAEALAAYLRSSAGGEVPDSNIRLLLNEEATQMQLAMALDWLQEESQPGDRAYIYFSGHGDVEKKTARQRGFLLTYDAPNTTYMAGGAFPILFLQDIIGVLSSEKDVEVILMADACRAGKLAGNSIGGNHVTAEKLAESYANEIKILSCQQDELSQEGERWGGGRGVFSYHLIEGLIGLADASGDSEVDLREIRNYLESQVGQETAGNQFPLVVGDLGHALAKVNNESLARLKEEKSELVMKEAVAMKNRGGSRPDPDTLIWQQYLAFNEAVKDKHLLYPEGGAAYTIYQKIAGETILRPYRDEMKRKLAVALHDEAQQAINAYLSTPQEELLKRWSHDDRYTYYPQYLGVAADLLGKDHFMYEDLRTRQLYFEGLELRLKGEQEKKKTLFQEALAKQQAVIGQDSSAAYAFNELGLLYRRLGEEKMATAYLDEAHENSPTWVLPMANLVGNYAELGKLEEAREMAKEALALDSSFTLIYHNLAYTYEIEENWEKAIEYYKKGVSFNPEYAPSYYNIGLAYYHRDELAETEKYFLEYAEKLADTDASIWSDLGYIASVQEKWDNAEQYFKKALTVNPDYELTYLNLGEFYLNNNRLAEAEEAYGTYVEKRPDRDVGHYMLAATLARMGRKEAALKELELAVKQGFDDAEKLDQDKHFESLRGNRTFKKLLQDLKSEK
ncbi:tetratricopeptide repeat protein [Flavilitoribacter nigricans]|nr:tetratricopeptide repeat protein [Flavilitoribacter nigricans]